MASIEKRGNSYRITVCLGTDIYGKKLSQKITYHPDPGLTPAREKKAVETFAFDFEQKVLNGKVLDGRKTTLYDFSERWLKEVGAQRLQPKTLAAYTDILNGIMPKLGHYKLTELKPAVLNSYFSSLTQDGARKDGKPGGYSRGTIAKAKNTLSSVLSTAVEWELIEKNPLERVHFNAEPTAETLKFWTPEQCTAFLEFIEKPYQVTTKGHTRTDDTGISYEVGDYTRTKELQEQLKVFINLALFSGLRKGELLALEWSDIDFENDVVTVSKSVGYSKGEQFLKAPKTKHSFRKVTIPHFLTQRIKAMKTDRLRYRLSVGDFWQGGEWLFIQENGKLMNYSTPYQAFHDSILRYNEYHLEPLPVIPLHGLRHTSATLLIANKQDIRSVSARLGHAETSTTLNIYTHFLESTDKKSADILENVLAKQA